MASRWLALAVLCVLGAASTPASADPAPRAGDAPPTQAQATAKHRGFPKTAATFQSELEVRIARMRARAARRAEGKSADEQRAIKSATESDITALRARAAQVTRDGVVTREEAREMRRAARAHRRERARARRGSCGAEHRRGPGGPNR